MKIDKIIQIIERLKCCVAYARLSEASGLSLRLEQGEDVSLPHWSFRVADNGAVAVVQKLHHHLCALALRSSAAQNLGDLGKFYWHQSLHYQGLVAKLLVLIKR